MVGVQDVFVLLQKQPGIHKQVVKVEGVSRTQAFLVLLVDARRLLGYGVARLVGKVARHNEFIFGGRDATAHRVQRNALRVYVEVVHNGLDKAF